MKPLMLAAALLLVPAAAPNVALAQVAAGAIPNSFDRPQAVAAQAAPAPAASIAGSEDRAGLTTTPANPRSEEALREIIAGGQAGTLPYALMTDDLAAKVREQEAAILPVLKDFGPIQALDFVGNQEGADLFAVTFATASTQWIIGFDESGKVAALLFRPAE